MAESRGTKRWYALKAKPQKETTAATLLEQAGIEIFLPLAREPGANGKPSVAKPFFPGYLFSRLDATTGEIRLATYTRGVMYVLGYDDCPWPVPDDVVLSIRERLARRNERQGASAFAPGERVVITSGPLKDLEAVFDRQLSPSGRVQVLLQLLRRACRVEMRSWQLRRAAQAVGGS